MTIGIVSIVLLAAFLHAVWNVLLKWQPDPTVGMSAFLCGTTLFGFIGVVIVGLPESTLWVYLVPSLCLHGLYHISLLSAYAKADFNFAYPVLRGAAPLLATFFALFFLDESLSLITFFGIVLACGGIIMLAKGASFSAIRAALLTAVFIASYSVVDAAGARVANDPIQFAFLLLMLDSVLYFPIAIRERGIRVLLNAPTKVYVLGAVGGFCAVMAYTLVIYAYAKAPVGAVSALREVSVIFGALIGWYVLKEKTALRIPGAVIITIGVILIIYGGQ